MATTSFRPTPGRDLHLGSVWNALQNWLRAKRTSGKFVMVVDDVCYEYGHGWASGFPVEVMVPRYLEDLEWFGIVPDRIEYSSANRERHRWANEKLGYGEYVQFANGTAWEYFDGVPACNPDNFDDRPSRLRTICEGDEGTLAPTFQPYYMTCCLVDDHDFGITAYVIGRDLLHLWAWVVDGYDRLGFAQPRIRFHRTLKRSAEAEKISKSADSGVRESTIRNLREAGYDPDRIIETLLELNVQAYIHGTEQIIIPSDVLTCEEVRYLTYRNRYLEEQMDPANWSDPPEPWAESLWERIPAMLPRVTRVTIAEDHRAKRAKERTDDTRTA